MSEANIVPPPTATKIILPPELHRQVRVSLREMRKTLDEVNVSLTMYQDPSPLFLELRAKDEPPARIVSPEDFA